MRICVKRGKFLYNYEYRLGIQNVYKKYQTYRIHTSSISPKSWLWISNILWEKGLRVDPFVRILHLFLLSCWFSSLAHLTMVSSEHCPIASGLSPKTCWWGHVQYTTSFFQRGKAFNSSSFIFAKNSSSLRLLRKEIINLWRNKEGSVPLMFSYMLLFSELHSLNKTTGYFCQYIHII